MECAFFLFSYFLPCVALACKVAKNNKFGIFPRSSIFSITILKKDRQSLVILILFLINQYISNMHACLFNIHEVKDMIDLRIFFKNMENDAVSLHTHTILFLILKTIELAQGLNSKFWEQLRSIFNRAVCHVYFRGHGKDFLL